MAFMMVLVVEEIEKVDLVLEAWVKAGASGATILESSGMQRRRGVHIPMRYLYGDDPGDRQANQTIFSLVENESIAAACLKAAEEVLGDLDQEEHGIFAAWPVGLVKGLVKKKE